KYAEYACIKSEKLFIARQFKTSLERYQELINEYPSITQRVQLGIVASYLGISQVNLSRIRAQIK
ncbi:Crp/Fnr family transcriptional regulator, partial [Escherichia coli]|nr:Crp/Fnr family transcriptional regulator [Escherichia coli]